MLLKLPITKNNANWLFHYIFKRSLYISIKYQVRKSYDLSEILASRTFQEWIILRTQLVN